MADNEKPRPMGQVIQIDEARRRDQLDEMVRGTVEEALNATLDAEADRLCGAGKYERTEGRKDTRAGSYERSLDSEKWSAQPMGPSSGRSQAPNGRAPLGRFGCAKSPAGQWVKLKMPKLRKQTFENEPLMRHWFKHNGE